MSSSLEVTVPSPATTVGVISLLYTVSPLCLCAGFTCVGQGRRCVGGSRCAPNELSFIFLTCPLADEGCCVTIWWRFSRHSTLHLLSIRDDVSTYTLLFTHPIVPWWRFNQHSVLRLLPHPDDVSTYIQLFTSLTVIWWRFNRHSSLRLFFNPNDVSAYILHLQYNTALLPSVNTIALGMFCGAKYIHHTLTPIIKHH